MFKEKLIGILLSGITGFSIIASAVEENKKPEITFNVSFNKFHANADFAKGKGTSTLQASLELRSVEGINGSALLMDAKEKCEYPVKDNLNMKSATVSMWVKPFNWTSEDKRFNCFFSVSSAKERFRLQIYAPNGKDAALYCEFKGNDKIEKKISVKAPVQWKKDEWHKIDACWDEKNMKIYLDGEPGDKVELQGIQLPELKDASFGLVPIWTSPSSRSHSTEDRTIIDEFKIYDGMLSGDTIRANYISERKQLSTDIEKSAVTVPSLKSPVNIDGKLDEDTWKSASMIPVMILPNSYPSDKITNVYLYHDQENIYIGFKSPCKDEAPIALHSKRDDKIWEDDSFEFFIFPPKQKKYSDKVTENEYYHFIINSNAVAYDAMVSNPDWNGDYDCKSHVDKNFWSVEMAIPFKTLNIQTPKSGDIWMANFCRNWKMAPPKRPVFTSWGTFRGSYRNSPGNIIFSDDRNAVQLDFKPGLSSGDLRLNIKNNSITEANCKLTVLTKGNNGISKSTVIKKQSDTEIKEILNGIKNAILNVKVASASPAMQLADYSVLLYVKDPMEVEYIPQLNQKNCLINIDYSNLDEKYIASIKNGELSLEINASGPGGIKSAKSFPVKSLKESYLLPVEWTDGEYNFEYTLKSGSGTIAHSKGKLLKPPTPWMNAKAGITDQVLEPWTPLQKTDDNNISCWGRTYKFNGLLPKSMINQGKDILAGPISILMETDKGTFPLTVKENQCAQMKPNRVDFQGNAVFGKSGIEAKWKMWMEYDGLVAVDLSIIPPKDGLNIKSLKMEIPLRKDIAQYIRTPKRVTWDGVEWKSSFEPYVWIGNFDEGFDFFFDSDKNWLYDKKAKVPSEITVKTEKDKTLITINIISQNAKVAKNLDYTFGFQATPVRPIMTDWRNFNSITRDWKGRNASTWSPGFCSQFALLDVVVPAEFQKSCAAIKEKGVKSFKYAGALSTPNDNPTFNFFKAEWANPYGSSFSNQKTQYHPNPYSLVPVSQASSYTDYLMWQAEEMVKNFDINSIYTDMDRLLPDENPFHGSGYRNDVFGRSGPTYDLLKRREFYKRLLTICRNAKRGIGLGMRMTHAHDELVLPYHSFNDLFFPGEQYTHKLYQKPYFYMDTLEPDAWRVELNSKASGINHIFLPEFGRGSGNMKDTENPDYTQSLIAVSILNDVMTSGSYCEKNSIEEIWALKAKTGINRNEARFIGYWQETCPLKADTDKSASSIYILPDHAVAVIVNFAPEQRNIHVNVNLKTLGLGNNITAFDERSGKEIAITSNSFNVPVKGRNYTLISLRKK